MIQHRSMRVAYSAIVYSLIFSMVFSPLAPQARVMAASSRQAQSERADPDLVPADFVFTKTVSVPGGKPRAEAGDTLRYNLSLTNNGADAQDVVVQDLLDANLSLVPGSLEVSPLAYDQSLTTLEDSPLSLTLTGSDGDGDSLLFVVALAPTHGSLSGTAPGLIYMPNPDFAGADQFSFIVNDGNGASQPGFITIDVTAQNDAPVCMDTSINTLEDTTGASTSPVCSDVDLDPLTYAIASQPAHGSASMVLDQLIFQPAIDFNGEDTFTYTASDGTSTSESALVNVTVTAVNDAPIAAPQSLTTNEDTILGITLGGIDVDGDPLTFSVTRQPLQGSLSGTAPDLSYTPAVNYYGPDDFIFEVCDNAAPPNCDSATVDLMVAAVNDAPSFTPGLDQTVLEGAGAVQVNPWATDLSAGPANETGQAISFQVLANTNPGLFTVEPALSSSGVLTFTPADNASGSAGITLRLEDNGGTSGGGINYSPSHTFTITITEVNDAPVVQASSFNLDENSANGTAVGTATYSDPDSGQIHSFAITAGNVGGAFNIDASTGFIRVASTAALNFEINPAFSLTIQVTDDGTPVQSGSNTVTIQLNDLEETPSVNSAAFDLDENSSNGTAVGTVTIGNQDAGETHTFAINSGNTNGAFAIDPATGEIQVANRSALDFETHPVFTLSIAVSDDHTPIHTGSNTVVVSLRNINEAPVVNAETFTLDENSANGTSLGSVSYTDPDTAQTHTYAITAGNDLGAYAIHPVTGSLSVADRTALDYETHPSFLLTIRVTDSGGLSGSASISIDMNDLNEAPVVTPATFSVNENSLFGVSVGTVNFSDQDSAQTHTFAITAGNTGGTFAIHSSSGLISVASAAGLDYETYPSFTLTVQVTDNGGLAGTAEIIVDLNDLNEIPAVNSATLNINENSANGTAVLPGPVTFTDPDAGQTHLFSITAGNSSEAFAIHPTTGAVTVADTTELDYETLTLYTLTVKVTDDGSPALFGTATITINVNDVDEAPFVTGEDYETIGNTLLEVSNGTAGPAPRIFINGNVLSNDVDPELAGPLTASLASGTSTNGGTVSMSEDGSFTYLPPAGLQGEDTFTYTVTDSGELSATGIVTITSQSMVWYVKNNAPAGGDGRSTRPFNLLSSARTASAADSTIYLFAGDGTTTGQNTGITLKSNQRLIGAGVDLIMPVKINGSDSFTNLLPAGSQPQIGNPSGDGVTVTNISGVEIRGLNLAGSVNAINISTSGATTATVTIKDNTVQSAGAAGIQIQAGGSSSLSADVQKNILTASGPGFDAQNTSTGKLILQFSENTITATGNGLVINDPGSVTTTITAFKNNTVHQNTGGSGVVITGVLFDATQGSAYDTVQAGSTKIGIPGDGVGAAGMTLTNVQGDLYFDDLDIAAEGGAGLRVSASGIFNSSGTGFRLIVAPGVGTLTSTGGPALDANTVKLDLPLASLTTNSSPTTGVSLNNVAGTVSAAAGSIKATTGTGFDVIGETANISYAGTITSSLGKAVSVVSHIGGTVAFTGAISGTGKGIFLNSNTGATISFSGGINLSTGLNPAFTATNGGTVSVTGTSNTLTTTTGVALNVANTTIGNTNLNFQSISTNGAAYGIVLNTTGGSGGLKITGTGSADSGGTLQNITSDCVSLTSTAAVEFNRLKIIGCGDTGIDASSVNGFIFRNGVVQNSGNANEEHGMRFIDLSGTALIQDTAITNAYEDGILLTNATGTLNMTVRRTNISQNNAIYGEDGFQIRLSSAVAYLLVEDSDFTNLQRDGIDATVLGSAKLDLTINNGNQFSNNHSNGGVNLSSSDTATLRLDLSGNTFKDFLDTPVNLVSMDTSIFEGRVKTNTIGAAGTPPLDGYGIRLAQEDNSTMTMDVTGNSIQNTFLSGFEAVARLATATGVVNLTMRNNTILAPVSDAFGAHIASGTIGTPTNNQICLDMGYTGTPGGNVVTGKGGFEGVGLLQRNGSTFQVEGWNKIAQPAVIGHVQAFNAPSTAWSSGTFTAGAVGSCLTPGPITLPPPVASMINPDLSMAVEPSPLKSVFSIVPFSSTSDTVTTPQGAPETVNINIGAMPAGKTVTITFDAQIAASLPENVLKIANQATATSSSFTGEVLSDDPATLIPADATETILYRSPAAHADAFSTQEDTPISVSGPGVLNNDSTAIGYEGLLTAIKDSNPASGTLAFMPDGSFTFTPDSNFIGVANFSYHAFDTQSGSNTAIVEIAVTSVNDAPVLDNRGPFSLLPVSQIAVNNPGTLVSAIISSAGGDPILDVDAGALEGMAVTSVNNTHGYWQYSIDGGTTWHNFDTPSTSAARLLAADAATRIRFVPDQTWNGVLDPGIRFNAWDRSSGANGETQDIQTTGGQTAFSATDATASILINGDIDLSLAMTTPAAQVIAGAGLNYGINITNAGPADATNVVVTDHLPAGVTFNGGSPQCTAVNQMVTCVVAGLGAGASIELTVSVVVDPDTRGALSNAAEVAADEVDQNLANNTSQVSVEVVASLLAYSLENQPGDEWNRPVMTTSPNGTQLMGEFGNETITLSLTDLPPHTQALVTFDLYIIRSWDGNQEIWPGEIDFSLNTAVKGLVGPDHWKLDADSKNLLDTTFANWSVLGFRQSYPKNYLDGSYPAQTGASELDGLGYSKRPVDSTYHMSYSIDHQNPSLTLDFSGNGLSEDLSDESWGLGNVKVMLTGGADLFPFKLFCPVTLR